MSETAAAQEVLVKDPVFINTPTGAVAVIGHELVSKKALVVLGHCLTVPETLSADTGGHNVHLVVFRDDGTPVDKDRRPLIGNCAPDTGSIAVNLDRIFEIACEEAGENTGESLWACYWRQFILCLLHEIHHLNFLRGVDLHDAGLVKEEEELAEEWSISALFELAKNVDIEPGNYREFPHFAADAIRAIEEGAEQEEGDAELAKEQKWMLENNIMHHLAADGEHPEMTTHTFKQFCQIMANDLDGEDWKKNTILSGVEEESLESKIRAIDSTLSPATTDPTPTASPTAIADEVAAGMGANIPAGPGPSINFASMEDMEIPEPDGIDEGDPNMAMMGMMMGGNYGPPLHEAVEDPSFPGPAYQPNPQPTPQPVSTPTNTTFPVSGQPAPQAPAAAPSNANFPVGGGSPAPQPAAPQGGFAVADQTSPVVDVYPKTGLSPQQTGEIVMGVYNKCYNHIFTHCGRKLNSDVGFDAPQMVNQMTIELTEQEKAVVVKMDCLDENDRWCPNMPTVNGLRGSIMKNTKLPCYKLYINEDGQEKVRLLLPQNPAKPGSYNGYSKPALQARGGSCIMYVMNGNDAEANATGKKFLLKCIDGTWQPC